LRAKNNKNPFMKKFTGILFLAVLVLTGCSRFREIDSKLTDLDSRVTNLENQMKQLNQEVSLIQELLSNKFFVYDVVPQDDPSGYRIILVDKNGNRKEYLVLNGKDGKDGQDGHDGEDGHDGQDGHDGVTPEIGIRQDTDGNYYWTLNGEWILVGGEKIRANGLDGKDGEDGDDGSDGEDGHDGADGLTPTFKIEDGKWYVKLGDGDWTYVGDAVTETTCIIADVDASADDVVVFTLAGGETITVPKAVQDVKLQIIVDSGAFAKLRSGATASTPYEVKVPTGVNYTLDSYEPEGWKVVFSTPKNNKGTLTITSASAKGKVLLVALGSDGSSFVKVLHVGEEGPDDPEEPEEPGTRTDEETVDSAGGTITLNQAATNIKVTSQTSWVKVSGKNLVISENTSYDSRTATVTYDEGDVKVTLNITQLQKDAIVIAASSIDVSAEAQSQTVVLSANVTVSAKSSVPWITVSPVTKGLEEKSFTLEVTANESTSERSGSVEFSSGDIKQTLTVKQAGKSPTPPAPAGSEYTLVTDASELEAGDQIIIVNVEASMAISTSQNNNNRGATSVTISDDVIYADELSGDVQIITLEGEEDAWNLSVDDGYLANASGDKNKLLTVKSVTSNATWTISVNGSGDAAITAGAGARNVLRYNPNNGSPVFACYASGQKPVAIFRLSGSSTPAEPVTQYETPGFYLSTTNTRTYEAGKNQYIREYNGNALTFAIVNPSAKEQVEITGYSSDMTIGSAATIQVDWKKNSVSTLSKSYSMSVLKDEGGKVWIGDDKGRGVIIRK